MATENQKWAGGIVAVLAAGTLGYILLRNPSKTAESVDDKAKNGVYYVYPGSEPAKDAPAQQPSVDQMVYGLDGKIGFKLPLAWDANQMMRAYVGAAEDLENTSGEFAYKDAKGHTYLGQKIAAPVAPKKQ